MSGEAGRTWDVRYAEAVGYRYGTEPNAFIAEEAPRRLAAGARVLCAGDGEGRNGVWLAGQGFEVVSLDPSAVGMRKAAALAVERGVTLETRVDAMPCAALPDESFDAVVLTFVHLQPAERQAVHADVVRVLRPGGVVLLEAFRPEQLRPDRVGGPPDLASRYTEATLRADFATLAVERLESPCVELHEGEFHRGPSEVVRLVARKLAPAMRP